MSPVRLVDFGLKKLDYHSRYVIPLLVVALSDAVSVAIAINVV